MKKFQTQGRPGCARLAGFTLFELIISVIIGLSVMVLGYKAYYTIQSGWMRFHAVGDKVRVILLFKWAMDNDMENAIAVQALDNGYIRITTSTDIIDYFFSSSIVRSHNTVTDTFDVEVKNITYSIVPYFEEKQVINEINIRVNEVRGVRDIRFVKRYSGAEQMALYTKKF